MGATRIMVIRHAEKPGTYGGIKYKGVTATVKKDEECLITLGWERAGGLVTLFAPPWGPKGPDLNTPQFLFAADPAETKGKKAKKKKKTDDDEPSRRPYQTITAVSAMLELPIDTEFKKDKYKKMADAALACDGVVLISWQHTDIPPMADHILEKTGTPAGTFAIPPKWDGDRFDLVWVFDRPIGDGPITAFTQVPQLLLAGDEDTVLPTS